MFTVRVGIVTPLASTASGIEHFHRWVGVERVAVLQLNRPTSPASVHTHRVIANLVGDPVISNLQTHKKTGNNRGVLMGHSLREIFLTHRETDYY